MIASRKPPRIDGTGFAATAGMRRFLLLLFLVLTALPAAAQETFFIERIDVRDVVRVSPEIIRAESRLREGQAYSEPALRGAVHRIKRLAFVRDAGFRLEKGTVRDTYVLVISIDEARPLFYLLDVTALASPRENTILGREDEALLGARLFVGRRGVAHLALITQHDDRPYTTNYSALQGGYTQYGLLGGKAFATVTFSTHVEGVNGSTDSTVMPGAVVGISLSPNQTLTLAYSAIENAGSRRPSTERMLETRLAYNTTNDPFFPSDGVLLAFAPVLVWGENPSPAVRRTFAAGADGTAARYFPIDERHSLAVVAEGGVARIHIQGDDPRTTFSRYGSVLLRGSRALGPLGEDDALEHRLELSLRASTNQPVYFRAPRDASTQLSVSWVRRDAWGSLRLGVGYAW